MKGKFLKTLGAIAIALVMSTACSSDDSTSSNDDDNSNSSSDCSTTITDQTAQGNFKGTSFASPGGSYRKQNFDGEISYFCRIHVKDPIDADDCIFPEYEGSQDSILFSLESLEEQAILLSDDSAQGTESVTLTFNRINDTGSEAELSCGTLLIDGLNANDQLIGSVVATGVDGSTINGNFVLDVCTSGF